MKRTPSAIALALAFAVALAACGHAQQPAQVDAETLPAPDAGQGSVTGMPAKPGPGQAGTPAAAEPASIAVATDAPPAPDATQGIAVGEQNPAAPSPPGGAEGPPPGDAVQLLRDYYAAIDAHDYGRAYRLWSGNGTASRQSPQQFADGFADTTGVGVDVGKPGEEDAGAGQRYIEIPVVVTATHADGSRHRYAGTYVLHRTVVDGASADQRAWRIDSARLRETTP